MIDFSNLADSIRSVLVGGGIQAKNIVMYNNEGNSTADPLQARSFYVDTPNLIVLIFEPDPNKDQTALLKFNYYGKEDNEKALIVYRKIKKLAGEFLINCELSKDTKQIKPADYASKFKSNKGQVMENNIQPKNSHLVGEIIKVIKKFKDAHESQILNDLGVGLEELRPALNSLVKDGKVKSELSKHGEPVYSMPVEEAITESFSKMFGTLKTSRQTFENVRILVKHKVPVNEEVRGSRTRQISSIFIECNGERFKFKENYLPGARAMARHLAHGGSVSDKVGIYITESTTQLLKLQSFNRYVTNNKLINEDSSDIVEIIKENIQTIKTELKKLTGVKTYEAVRARIDTFERENLSEDDVSNIKELFTIKKFDEKFEEVLPIVKQLIQEKGTYHKRIEEAAGKDINIRKEPINTTPVLEFTSENAKFGYKLSELSFRILENQELSEFINKIGNKICKNGEVNDFEKAILEQVFENIKIVEDKKVEKSEIKESTDLEMFFEKFDHKFM